MSQPRICFYALRAASLVTMTAAIAHLLCIIIGADAYLLMGAGQYVADAVRQGDTSPHITTASIASVLFVWSAIAWLASTNYQRVPVVRPLLLLIGSVLVLRGVLFVYLIPLFPGNSQTFWWVSSSLCGLLGLLYLVGALALSTKSNAD